MRQIPITKPLLGDAEFEAVREPIESGWVLQGPRVLEFESRFASFTGSADVRTPLTLPLYPQMTEEEQDFVVSALHQVPELVR